MNKYFPTVRKSSQDADFHLIIPRVRRCSQDLSGGCQGIVTPVPEIGTTNKMVTFDYQLKLETVVFEK